jgi:hypothetical protein
MVQTITLFCIKKSDLMHKLLQKTFIFDAVLSLLLSKKISLFQLEIVMIARRYHLFDIEDFFSFFTHLNDSLITRRDFLKKINMLFERFFPHYKR